MNMQRCAVRTCPQPSLAAAPTRHPRSRSADHRQRSTYSVATHAGLQEIELHFGETTVAFPLAADQAKQLAAAVAGVMHTFAEKQKAERPKRWDSMEFKMKGDPTSGELEYLVIFCNPNAHSTAFDARVLVTLRAAGGVRLATEGKLSAVKADVEAHLDKQRPAA